MPRARYHLLDVFTDRPFAGNPLAVFVDPPALTTDQMQTIAGELNLSETVFAHPPGDGPAWPTRTFTPTTELPFAGHPTIGTAVLLAELGLADDRRRGRGVGRPPRRQPPAPQGTAAVGHRAGRRDGPPERAARRPRLVPPPLR